MPLSRGYSVLIDAVANHHIDPPDHLGRWPHYHIEVKTDSDTLYDSAINLKSISEAKVKYRDFRNADRKFFSNILSTTDGLHTLASNSESGALDVIRHPGLQDPVCEQKPKASSTNIETNDLNRCPCTQWWLESGTNTIELMKYYLDSVNRVYIFGEPYENNKGVHNVHMTQGDPVGSEFAVEDGIWQDGGVIFEYTQPEPRLSILITKFQTQSLNTDNNGRPV